MPRDLGEAAHGRDQPVLLVRRNALGRDRPFWLRNRGSKPRNHSPARQLSLPNRMLRWSDPLDRLLIAQAKSEPPLLMTNDPLIARYPVELV